MSNKSCILRERVCVPQQLIEVKELLKSITTRLEDCGLEWQAVISRKQWRICNTKPENLEESVLARTYFIQKSLDEAFQRLLSSNKIFSEYLEHFIGKSNFAKL